MLELTNKTVAHKFHLVDPSPWPFLVCTSLFFLLLGAVFSFHGKFFGHVIASFGFLGLIFSVSNWWIDVVKEGRVDKAHNETVQAGLSLGMLLFILSEVMFFFVFFWSFFKSSLSPVGILDGVWALKEGSWPPENIETIDPWNIPFLNTLILLLSGTSVTWAHYSAIHNKKADLVRALGITVLLGIIFTLLQIYEYHHASFGFKDGIFASNFYMATGFHGFHVLVGTIFLAVCYFRARSGHFSKDENILGLEFAAWYWHFVDVVWLFLFIFVYVWGG